MAQFLEVSAAPIRRRTLDEQVELGCFRSGNFDNDPRRSRCIVAMDCADCQRPTLSQGDLLRNATLGRRECLVIGGSAARYDELCSSLGRDAQVFTNPVNN